MNDNLKIIFEIQKQIIIQIQIKMFQFWSFDNFMTLIYSILFDFRRNELKNFDNIIDMLKNNIINFIKNKNNFDSLKKLESECYENHYKIVPSKNIKNKIN